MSFINLVLRSRPKVGVLRLEGRRTATGEVVSVAIPPDAVLRTAPQMRSVESNSIQ
jgi:hypothetical protein